MPKVHRAPGTNSHHEGNGQALPDVDPRAEVLTTLHVLYRPGQVVELRVPNYPRGNATTAGYFNDAEALAESALGLDGLAPGIYVTLNEIDPALLARQNNRYEQWAKQTTADADVRRRRWLPLDFDPVRPAGIPSTDAEHAAALARAQACRAWLAEQGWPDPVEADSGNGAHLLYPLDLPNDEQAKAWVEGCLHAVAAQFSDDAVTLDVKVGNAARIWKLYGTLAAKGDGTAERPHRRARLLSTPRQPAPVPAEQLEALATLAPSPASAPPSANGTPGRHRLDVRRWLKGGIAFRVKAENGPQRCTVYRITCPFDPSHTDASVMQDPDGKLSAKCFHNSCDGRGWAEFKEQIGAPDPAHYDPPLRMAATTDGGITGIKIIPIAPPELAEAAYLGLAGEFLRAVAPYTEATDAGVLAHFLPTVGTLIGPGPHAWAGNRQPARINTVLVGPTNAGRKGTAFGPVDLLMRRVAPKFWSRQKVDGLSSGEGLIAYVADREEPDKDGKPKIVPVEKRLYVVEEEFSRVLANMARDGNVLSQIIRSCFDTGNLATLTVNPRVAAGAHVSITGHITPADLTEKLSRVEMANGFGNRFLWFAVASDKLMPETRPIPPEVFEPFVRRLTGLSLFGMFYKEDHPVELDAGARDLWKKVYPRLRQDRPGLAGEMVSRGAPFVLRLALIYAVLDCPTVEETAPDCPTLAEKITGPVPDRGLLAVRPEHLAAALAVWDYCEASVRLLFGGRTGDPLADKLLQLLDGGPKTKDEFNRHLSERQKKDVGPALAKLESAGQVRRTKVAHEGAGRPAERWEKV